MAIVLFTDFGTEGPYTGQMESVIDALAPDVRIIKLVSNAPATNPLLSAYLLAAVSQGFTQQTVFLAVVDPGVGGQRAAVVLNADGRFFVGPDNGLFNTVAVHSERSQWFRINHSTLLSSNTFHGRDVFAPVAARLANGSIEKNLQPIAKSLTDWPGDLYQIIYFDHFGNAMTGIRYQSSFDGRILQINGNKIHQADTFCSVKAGEVFWYNNSSGLIEIAANRTSAKIILKLSLGDRVAV